MIRRLIVAVPLLLGLIGSTTAVITTTPASAGTGGAMVSAPITTALVQGGVTWLVVPMGHLSDFLNTFWQLFVRTPTDAGWVTVTPPGVADNGGLVITAGPDGGLLAGFLANQDLTFSPLSLTTDGGQKWTAVYFPQGLIAVPDALGGTTGMTVALGRSGQGSLFETGADLSSLSSWRPAVTVARLRRSAAGARCGVDRLTATVVAPDGDPLLGAACASPGGRRSLRCAAGGAKAVAFPVSSTLTGATVSVLRLVPTASGVAVLLEGPGAHRSDGAGGRLAVPLGPTDRALGAARGAGGGKAPGQRDHPGRWRLRPPPAGQRERPELADVTASRTGEPAWDMPPRPRGYLGSGIFLRTNRRGDRPLLDTHRLCVRPELRDLGALTGSPRPRSVRLEQLSPERCLT